MNQSSVRVYIHIGTLETVLLDMILDIIIHF